MQQIGNFTVVEEIARGGMGVVYRARDPIGREVALKLLLSQQADPRFRQEAQALARLRHPGIVQIHEFDTDAEGREYLVMEFVEGESLKQRLDRTGPLPVERALELALQLCDALTYAHLEGVIHRDLKPHNVLLTAEGVAKVTDFGLGKITNQSESLTNTGEMLGTPAYMPPEQAEGDKAAMGPRSDVYGLGATLYALLLARPPFVAPSAYNLLYAVLTHTPESPAQLDPKIPPWLDAVVLRCLAKEPSDRFPDMRALKKALQRGAERVEVTPKASRAPLLAGGLLLLGVVGATAVILGRRPPATLPDPVPVTRQDAPVPESTVEQFKRAAELATGRSDERERAGSILLGLLESDPDDVEARMLLGRLEFRSGRAVEAIEHFNRVLSVDPARRDALYHRAECHRRLGRPRFALLDYENAGTGAEEAGGAPLAEILAGQALAKLAFLDLDAARETLKEAASLAHPRLRLAEATLLQYEGSDARALVLLADAVRAAPEDAEIRLAHAAALARLGDTPRALVELAKSLELGPSAAAWHSRGRLRALACDDAGASQDLQRALELSPDGDPVRYQVLLTQARHLRAQGQYAEAVAVLEQPLGTTGVQGAPVVPFLLERAEIRSALGGPEELKGAKADLQIALELSPDDVRAQTGLARLWILEREFDKARDVLAPLLERDPPPAEALALKGRLPRQRVRRPRFVKVTSRSAQRDLLASEPPLGFEPLAEALRMFQDGRRGLANLRTASWPDPAVEELANEKIRRAARLAPWLTEARVSAVELQFLAVDSRTTLDLLEEILETCPTTASALALKGTALAKLDRHAEATEALQASLTELGSRDPLMRSRILVTRANSSASLGQFEDARRDLEQAIDLQPALPTPYQMRRELRSRLGDQAGALEDEARLELLRFGSREILEQAIHQSTLRPTGDLAADLEALSPAFQALSPVLDPALAARLHHRRAVTRSRSLQLPLALLDFARMLELWPASFQYLFEQLGILGQASELDFAKAVIEGPPEDAGLVDPDFLAGFRAFLLAEFSAESDSTTVERGSQQLGHFLARNPGHQGALLMRAALHLAQDRLGPATRVTLAALEAPTPSSFGHYMLGRIRALQGDMDGALASLERGSQRGFTAIPRLETDPYLAGLRASPRYKRLLSLLQAGLRLAAGEIAAGFAAAEPARREIFLQSGAEIAVTGLKRLNPMILAGDLGARVLAARIYMTRARSLASVRDEDPPLAYLAAALEASPEILLRWESIYAAAVALESVPPSRFTNLKPSGDEVLPGRFARVVPTLLQVFRGGAVSDVDLRSARSELDALALDGALPGVEAWQAILALAADQHEESLEFARRLAERSPSMRGVTAWLSARVHATRDRPDAAFAELRIALEAGLLGPLEQDPALRRLEDDARFAPALNWSASNAHVSRRW